MYRNSSLVFVYRILYDNRVTITFNRYLTETKTDNLFISTMLNFGYFLRLNYYNLLNANILRIFYPLMLITQIFKPITQIVSSITYLCNLPFNLCNHNFNKLLFYKEFIPTISALLYKPWPFFEPAAIS